MAWRKMQTWSAAIRWAQCQRENLQAITAAKPTDVACEKSHVEYACVNACMKRADLRIPVDRPTGTHYTYNCQTMTRTAIPDNACLIKEFVTGCPAIPIAGVMVNGLSVLLFAIMALIFA